MGFYRRVLFPRLLDRTMRAREAAERRARLLPAAAGRVLEVGIGSAHNLPFYGPSVSEVTGVDPSPELLAIARRRHRGGVPLILVEGGAESLPFEDARFDTAVSTWSLCSMADLAVALAEVRRVLKPGGMFLFVEHGRAPDAAIARWQARLDPLWTRIAGGCHLDRAIDRAIVAAGFRVERLETGYMAVPRVLGFTYEGVARPA